MGRSVGTENRLSVDYEAILEVKELSKTYAPPPAWLKPVLRSASSQPKHALKKVSFGAHRGHVVGVIGENGAGKTTLFRCLSGLLTMNTGDVLIRGVSVRTEPTKAAHSVGVVLEGERGLYGRLTGRQNLEFFSGLYGLDPPVASRRIDRLMDAVGLGNERGLVFGYSSGMRVRLSMARALLSEPLLLLLDEPTRSLDAQFKGKVQSMMREHVGTGGTVLVSSHDLHMISEVCDTILVLHQGSLVAEYAGNGPDSVGVETLIKALERAI